MAVIKPTYNVELERLVTVRWANVSSADTTVPYRIRGKHDLLAVQAEGTWNSTTMKLQGSLSNVALVNASDMTQSTISFTAHAAAGVLEPLVYWKPVVSGGTGDSVTITLTHWVDE